MIKVKGIYGSGMVLQQNATSCIFGSSDSKCTVIMKFRGQQYSAKTDEKGNWKIEYNPGAAGGPFEMKLQAVEPDKTDAKTIQSITFENVFTGEVWVNSGQSNAQLPMERLKYSYPDEMTLPENPFIRMITIPISYAFDGEKDSIENPMWQAASPETLGTFSGTAYFFAKKLQEDLQVPVGIINASQGGSPISAWMNEKALAELNKTDYVKRIQNCRKEGFIQTKLDDIKQKQNKWFSKIEAADKGLKENWEKLTFDKLDASWEACEIPGDFQISTEAAVEWFKKEITLTAEEIQQFNSKKTRIWLGTIMDADRVWVNETFVGVTYYTYPPRRYEIPAGTLREGKNTITVRVQKNGENPIRFYKEKPYCIFTEDIYVHPVAYRNVEVPALTEKNSNRKTSADNKDKNKGVKIDLSGSWKMKTGCTLEKYPGEVFFEWEPSALYNAMLSPAFNYAVKGALWYQGESDSLIFAEYKDLLVKMMGLWREKFIYAPENMPFVIMQLPNWNDGNSGHGDFSDWAEMRAAQNQAVKAVENAAISVCIDAGEWNDLHPEKKRTGGTRAANQALRIAYNKEYEAAAEFEAYTKTEKTIKIRFTCASELKAFAVENNRADFSKTVSKVYGFEFLTESKKLLEAEAVLVSPKEIEVSIPETTEKLTELRYLWCNSPDIINLYSAEKLPAQSFRIKL